MSGHDQRTSAAGAWIMGAGRFGRRAVDLLRRMRPQMPLTVVDRNPEALTAVRIPGVETAVEDAVAFMARRLRESDQPEWIVPCVPFHLAYEWLLARLGRSAAPTPVPREFAAGLPHPFAVDRGGFAMSYADFICPPDCPEPSDICTHTGRPRPGHLYADLESRPCPGFQIRVVRSRQLAPGLGGFRPQDLFHLEERIRDVGGAVLVATACRCHGIIHGLRQA